MKLNLRHAVVSFFLIFSAGNSFSQLENEADSIDITMRHCIDTAFGTYGDIMCIDDAIIAWDHELNNAYQQLMKEIPADQQELLKTSQRAWIQYRDQELEWMTAYYSRQGSSWGYTIAYRNLEIIRTRTLELRHYLGDY